MIFIHYGHCRCYLVFFWSFLVELGLQSMVSDIQSLSFLLKVFILEGFRDIRLGCCLGFVRVASWTFLKVCRDSLDGLLRPYGTSWGHFEELLGTSLGLFLFF